MTLPEFQSLLREDGQALLAMLARESLGEHDLLTVVERYRKQYPVELVRAAVEVAQLRRRGLEKFPSADRMYFTRDSLAMASSETVARHTARRFAGLAHVLDLCCGIGGDALALAENARRVLAVDRDPLALAMARANARAVHLEDRIEFIEADVTEFVQNLPLILGRPDAIFADPSRREAAHAARRPQAYAPTLAWCLELIRVALRVGIKTSPAMDYEDALDALPAEVEIISLHGECKETMLWLGEFRTCARRASILPEQVTLTDTGSTSAAVAEVGEWIYEPDPAVIRAHLIQRLAGEFRLWRIDRDIAYLSNDAPVKSPFMKTYHVTAVLPWSLKGLNAALTARKIGQVTIKKRGFPLTPDELRPKLKLRGPHSATLICTRVMDKPMVVLADVE